MNLCRCGAPVGKNRFATCSFRCAVEESRARRVQPGATRAPAFLADCLGRWFVKMPAGGGVWVWR